MHKYGVYIGRFQPFHSAHLKILRIALEKVENLILILGSSKAARNTKNPWTHEEREFMVRSCLTKEENDRLIVMPVRDHLYSDTNWFTEIQQKVSMATDNNKDVALFGAVKDDSSYYLNSFPQWKFIETKINEPINATDIRDQYFNLEVDNYISSHVPDPVGKIMEDFAQTDIYSNLVDEYQYIKDYKKSWANTPYPVVFNTVDTVVIKSGHILLVKRKFNPGKGLYALPGGFVNQKETLLQAAIRELREETGIKVFRYDLLPYVLNPDTPYVFDAPERSLRGRTITYVYVLDMGSGELPDIKGGDDAEKAIWVPLNDLDELMFFEDHKHIIRKVTGKHF